MVKRRSRPPGAIECLLGESLGWEAASIWKPCCPRFSHLQTNYLILAASLMAIIHFLNLNSRRYQYRHFPLSSSVRSPIHRSPYCCAARLQRACTSRTGNVVRG